MTLVWLGAAACWSSTGADLDAGDEAPDRHADVETDSADFAWEDASPDSDTAPDGGDVTEDREEAAEDWDADGWPPLPAGCIGPGRFPDGSVSCSRGVPRCPDVFSYCCLTNYCGSMEFGAQGCCGSSDCGDPTGFHCIEAIGESLPQVCTRPEPEFRCPLDHPFCCFNVLGAAVCADHALLGWDSCEDQWADGSGS